MPNIAEKTVVAQCACHDCGKVVRAKVNKNGIVYYFCAHASETDGERCNAQHRWGRKISQQMQREYLMQRVANKNEAPKGTPDNGQSANIPDQPDKQDSRDGSGGNFLCG